jgi:hypothetical protein
MIGRKEESHEQILPEKIIKRPRDIACAPVRRVLKFMQKETLR